MLSLPLLLFALPCSEIWPDGSRAFNDANPPSNLVVWANERAAGMPLVLLREDGRGDEEVDFEPLGERRLTIDGRQLRAYAAPDGLEEGCFTIPGLNGRTCVGTEEDDEPPIDPVINASIDAPSFGSDNNSGFDLAPPIHTCVGKGNGNLRLTIEADEPGPLLAQVVIKDGADELYNEAFSMEGRMQRRFDVSGHSKVLVQVRFIDRAGHEGEVAELELDVPASTGCQGCSHSGLGLFLLAGLAGIRRRRS